MINKKKKMFTFKTFLLLTSVINSTADFTSVIVSENKIMNVKMSDIFKHIFSYIPI
jgi:hypothetical protein